MMRNLLGSLIVKIGFGLCLMTATIVMAIAISDGVFREASDSMRDLGEERVPALVAQADALAATTEFQQALSDLLLAPDTGRSMARARKRPPSLTVFPPQPGRPATRAGRKSALPPSAS